MNSRLLFGIIFTTMLMLPIAAGLGVTPARTTLNFEPGLEQTVGFSVINSEHKEMNLVLYSQGELNQSIYLTENIIELSASEESKRLEYKLKLPQELGPGLHTAEVVILEIPANAKTSEAFIGAAVGVTTQLHVFVPYPGKYAEADLNVIDAEKGGDVKFVIPVINLGNLGLVNVKANVDIYNKMNEKIASFNSEEISLAPNEKKDIVTQWKADAEVGMYRAVATVIYDGQTTKPIERTFSIGTSTLDLQEVEVKDFRLGEIAKFEMLVENKWSEIIRGAYAQTKVYNKEGAVMADFKSPTTDIPPFEKVVLTSYWDTGGVQQGTYDASVFLRYGEKSSQKDLQLKVSDDQIEIVGLGYVISERKSGRGDNNSLVMILVVVIGVLVLINVVWFLVLRKRLASLPNKK